MTDWVWKRFSEAPLTGPLSHARPQQMDLLRDTKPTCCVDGCEKQSVVSWSILDDEGNDKTGHYCEEHDPFKGWGSDVPLPPLELAAAQGDLALYGTAIIRVDKDKKVRHVRLERAFKPALVKISVPPSCRVPPPEKRPRRLAIRIKILTNVDFTEDGCWLWRGGDSGNGRGGGYGRIWLDRQVMATHKVMWINENGAIPGKMQLDHLCGNRRCCNPDHLEMVTNQENAQRRAARQKDR